MKIATNKDFITTESVRLADIGNSVIINTVPYDKVNNSPYPFTNINMIRNSSLACGKGIHTVLRTIGMQDEKRIDQNSPSSTLYSMKNIFVDTTFKNTLVDNKNPNITYVIPSVCQRDILRDKLNNQDPNNTNYKIYKIIKDDAGNFNIQSNYIKESCKVYTNSSNKYFEPSINCVYMTQTDTHVFAIIESGALVETLSRSSSGSVYYILKIEKESLFYDYRPISIYSNAENQLNYENKESYLFTSSSTPGACYHRFKVIKELPNGLIILGYFAASNGILLKPIFYNFADTKVSLITCTGTTPYGYSANNYLSFTSSSSNNVNYKVTVPSDGLENETEYYTYLFDSTEAFSTTTPGVKQLLRAKVLKENTNEMIFEEYELVFPEENTITALPYDLTYQKYYSYSSGQNDFVHKAFAANYDTGEYVHLFYIGSKQAPISQRGIYTFKIDNELKTATFKSFYQTQNGSLIEFIPINDKRDKVCIVTNNTYHFLKFDTSTETWKSTFDYVATVKSLALTDQNKMYAILEDESIICNDLNSAVLLDFNFEMPFYEFKGSEIPTYINVWAKDFEDTYREVNIRLILAGEATWQENGQKILETTTSSDGPKKVMFNIKGQTTINVSIEATI